MHLSTDQSFSSLFGAVSVGQNNEIRPVQFLEYVAAYKLFSLNPLGYHLLNVFFFIIGLVFVYMTLVELFEGRVLAISTTALYMLLPNYSTDRFWFAAHATNISMCLTFIGIYIHLRGLRRPPPEFWKWEAFAVLFIIGSGLTYEVFLPLVVATTIFLFVSELTADWPQSLNGPTIARAALRQVAIILSVVLIIAAKAKWARRSSGVDFTDPLWALHYASYISHYIVKAFVYSYGYHLFELPWKVWHAFVEYAEWAQVVMASAIGILIFCKLYISWDSSSAETITLRRKMWRYVGCGIILFIAGYSLVPINPAKDGFNNRSAIAGTLGVAISLVGLFGMSTWLVAAHWRKTLFSALVGVTGMSGALIIDVLANFWVQSYRLQNEILSDIYTHIPALPAGTTLILDGICRYSGPAPVFEAPWDLAYALSIYYGHLGIKANVVSRGLTIAPDGLIAPSTAGPITYPFHELYVYHFGRETTLALPNARAAQNYFDEISTNRASRCPADFYGNGVEVLGGFIPMLGRDPTSTDAAPRS
jgi:hypothetical protein